MYTHLDLKTELRWYEITSILTNYYLLFLSHIHIIILVQKSRNCIFF